MSHTIHKRADRVGQLIQQELGQMLVDELKDPRVGFVTVTEVRISDDLRNARIYVSVYGSEGEQKRSLEGLKAAEGYLKREIARRLKLRFTPELLFSYDDTLEKSQRIETIMTAIAQGKTEVPSAESMYALPVDTFRSEMLEQAQSFKTSKNKPSKASRQGRRRRVRGSNS